MSKIMYKGFRHPDGSTQVSKVTGRTEYDFEALNPRFDLKDHLSPGNFLEWGYGGNGPAQLALAILADHYLDDKFAVQHYQKFKWKVIAKLPYRGSWNLTDDDIENAICEIKKEKV